MVFFRSISNSYAECIDYYPKTDMKKTPLSPLGIAAALALFSSSASAATILDTKFGSTTQPNASNIVVTADTMLADFGSTVTLTRGSAFGGFTPQTIGTVPDTGIGSNSSIQSGSTNTLATAIANDHFIEFTLTSGVAYDIDTISFDMAGFGSNNAQFLGYLLTDATGFSNGNELGSVDALYNETITSSGTIDVSAIAAFDGRTSTKFRVYLVDNHDGDNTNRKFGLTSIAITGTQSIPEPSAYALVGGVFAFGFAMFCRRK